MTNQNPINQERVGHRSIEKVAMHDFATIIHQEWVNALNYFGISLELGRSHIDAILVAHSQSGRFYHNLQHLCEMFDFIRATGMQLEFPSEVALAVLFHDVVYNSQAKDNEEQSAELAKNSLAAIGVSPISISRVGSLILATKRHLLVENLKDSALFLDADLNILGATPARYAEYAEAIRKEYEWVSHKDYCIGRANVMQSFLDRQKIYYLSEKYPEKEAEARRNISLEISILQNSINENTLDFTPLHCGS